MVVIAEEWRVNNLWSTRTNGWASHCRHCCTLQKTEVDGGPEQQLGVMEVSYG